MIEHPVLNVRGEQVGTIQLDERVFGIEPNMAVVHQAVVAQQANARRGTHSTKTRGEVAGGGRKPWRQKGTGRARQGSIRAPHWRGGGVVFGPHPRSYHQDLPRKMRRLAMRSALAAKRRANELIVLDELTLPFPRTKEMVRVLEALGIEKGALFVLAERDPAVLRATANLPKVEAVSVNEMNLLDVLRLPQLVMTRAAVELATQRLTAPIDRRPRVVRLAAAAAGEAAG